METKPCAVCQTPVTRYAKHFKSPNAFCSRKHKEKGMMLGLCNPSRLGTGYGIDDILRRRKYYKYKAFDRRFGLETLTITVREFCKLLAEAKCTYCGSSKDVGMDRIDNKLGHCDGNTVWACSLCNMTRGNRFTVDEMRKIGEVIRSLR